MWCIARRSCRTIRSSVGQGEDDFYLMRFSCDRCLGVPEIAIWSTFADLTEHLASIIQRRAINAHVAQTARGALLLPNMLLGAVRILGMD